MFCTNCGTANIDDAKFCVNCGESLSEVQGKFPFLQILKDRSFVKEINSLQGLFDFSFNQCITSKIVPFLYGLSLLSAGLLALLFILFGFNTSTVLGIFILLIGAPLLFLLMVILSRVCLESMIVLFRISRQTAKREGNPESKDNIEWNV